MAGRQTPLGRSPRAELGIIDYTLAKRALLRDAKRGTLGLTDLCDAHPELIRAAKHVDATVEDVLAGNFAQIRECPMCGGCGTVATPATRRELEPTRGK